MRTPVFNVAKPIVKRRIVFLVLFFFFFLDDDRWKNFASRIAANDNNNTAADEIGLQTAAVKTTGQNGFYGYIITICFLVFFSPTRTSRSD